MPSTPPGAPPPRRGKPWWVWTLAGCGGCAVLVVVGGLIATAVGVNQFKAAMDAGGPVTEASVAQSLGGDVPVYPKAVLNPMVTKVTRATLTTMSKMTGKPFDQMFKGVGAYTSADSPDKVISFYDAKLKKLGWKMTKEQSTGMQEQHMFMKKSDGLMVQVQNQQGSTIIILMRGNPTAIQGTAGAQKN